jgi:hypothetical protein
MTHRDDSGNVQVDFVWGNLPLQPDDDRLDSTIYTAGVENQGWSGYYKYLSDTLRTSDYNLTLNNLTSKASADSHTIATTGYSNFPGYIENYAGDGDADLEHAIPNLVGKTLLAAETITDSLDFDLTATAHYIEIQSIESDGTTVRVYAYDQNYWDTNIALVGLKIGDKVWVDNDEYDFGNDTVTITALESDGSDSWIEFETATAISPALDTSANGNIWPGPDLEEVITLHRWAQPGAIRDEGYDVRVRYLATWEL